MTENLNVDRKKTRSEKIAYGITVATISPFQLLLILWFTYSICHAPQLFALGDQGYVYVYLYEFILDTVSIFFISIFPLIPVFILKKQGKIQSYTTQREDRFVLLGISLIGWFAIIPIYIILDQILAVNLRNFIIFSAAYFIIAVINIIFTTGFKFKTSLHMSGATSSILMIYISYGIYGGVPEYQLLILLFLFLIPIAWAKWKMQKSFKKGHTIPQLISGFLIGLLVVCFTIYFFQLYGFPIAWY